MPFRRSEILSRNIHTKAINNLKMGNKTLRPSEEDPLRGFDDEQLQYLAEKFELVSTDGLLDTSKLA